MSVCVYACAELSEKVLGKHLGKNKSCKLIISLIRRAQTDEVDWYVERVAQVLKVLSLVVAAALSMEAWSIPPLLSGKTITCRFKSLWKCAQVRNVFYDVFMWFSFYIASPLSSLLRFVFIKFSTHTHAHTNTLMQSSLICSLAARGILFTLSVFSRFNKRNLSNSNARKCLSQPRQAVCLPSLAFLFLPLLLLKHSLSCFVTVYPTWTHSPFSVLPLVLANHIVCFHWNFTIQWISF